MMIDAAVGVVLFVVLLALIYGPWQWVCTDIARQFIFEHRDAIFDLAHDDKLAFGSPDYRTIRRSLEKAIRYAHELTLGRFLYLWAASKLRGEKTYPTELFAAIDRIKDDDVRIEVRRRVQASLLVAAGVMFLKSPITMLILLPAAVVIKSIPALFRWCARKAAETGQMIQGEAEAVIDDQRFAH